MAKPRKKKMGRPLENVPLRKLVKGIRQDIENRLADIRPADLELHIHKSKRNKE